jgi:argininosuccinate lyase
VNSAEFAKERIEPTLDRGFLDATSLAEYLVTKGIPFRTAHQIVGALVKKCEETGRYALKQLSIDDFNEVIAGKSDVRVDQDVYDALGAHNVVKRYQSAGATVGALPSRGGALHFSLHTCDLSFASSSASRSSGSAS